MTKVLLNMLSGLWKVVRVPLFSAVLAFAIFGLWTFLFFVFFYLRGARRPEGEHHNAPRPFWLYALFLQFPIRYAKDYFSRNPEYFRHQGVVVFTGRQGSGKTVALVEQTMRWQKEYPKSKCISNLDYKYQDDELNDWRPLVEYSNGIQGVIVQMDEMQNWFSSNQSKNFPPEFLEVITQNRKNRRVILGTSQVFTRLSKPLREQCTEVRCCYTLFGCLTLVVRKEPILDSSGDVTEYKRRGFYWFVHTEEIRNAYDTYHVIESLAKSGFQEKTPDAPSARVYISPGKKGR